MAWKIYFLLISELVKIGWFSWATSPETLTERSLLQSPCGSARFKVLSTAILRIHSLCIANMLRHSMESCMWSLQVGSGYDNYHLPPNNTDQKPITWDLPDTRESDYTVFLSVLGEKIRLLCTYITSVITDLLWIKPGWFYPWRYIFCEWTNKAQLQTTKGWIQDLLYGDSIKKPCLQPFSNGPKPRLFKDKELMPLPSGAKMYAPMEMIEFKYLYFMKIKLFQIFVVLFSWKYRAKERLSKYLFDNLLQIQSHTRKIKDDFYLVGWWRMTTLSNYIKWLTHTHAHKW